MDSVGKVAQTVWNRAHQTTLDHSSGFHHVPLDAESMQYFGFFWDGEDFVWSTLCFVWCPSPLVYHILSTAVAQYLREKGVPTLAWIDDFHITICFA